MVKIAVDFHERLRFPRGDCGVSKRNLSGLERRELDPPKMLTHFGRAVNIRGRLFNVLREIEGNGRPRRQSRGGSHPSPWKASSRSGNPRVINQNKKLYENSLF
jgi:hypothetical protein